MFEQRSKPDAKRFADRGALRIERVRTQVDWEQLGLLRFLQRNGFGPAPRFCLERRL